MEFFFDASYKPAKSDQASASAFFSCAFLVPEARSHNPDAFYALQRDSVPDFLSFWIPIF